MKLLGQAFQHHQKNYGCSPSKAVYTTIYNFGIQSVVFGLVPPGSLLEMQNISLTPLQTHWIRIPRFFISLLKLDKPWYTI